jgi:toxin-antitoxin system PIN domain toxin
VGVCDVNPLLYAHREESPQNAEYREWLRSYLDSGEPFELPRTVASGFYRIATNPRVFTEPSLPSDALAFLDEILRSPSARPMTEGPRHWSIFTGLCVDLGIRGAEASDAYIAAFALETETKLFTADRGMLRHPGLRVRHPLH